MEESMTTPRKNLGVQLTGGDGGSSEGGKDSSTPEGEAGSYGRLVPRGTERNGEGKNSAGGKRMPRTKKSMVRRQRKRSGILSGKEGRVCRKEPAVLRKKGDKSSEKKEGTVELPSGERRARVKTRDKTSQKKVLRLLKDLGEGEASVKEKRRRIL